VLPVLPLYARRELYASDEMVGLIVSSYFIARVCVELPGGAISDRIGRRKPIILGMLLGSIGGLVLGLASNAILFLLGRAIWGAGTALFFSSTYSLLFDLFPPNLRGKSMGTFQSVEMIGSFIGAPIGGILAEVLGMRQIFYLSVVILTTGFVITSLFKGLKIEGDKNNAEKSSHFSVNTAFSLLKNWGLIVVSIGAFVRMLVMQGIRATILPIYLNGFGISEAWIGIVIGVSSLGQIFATFTAGTLTRKIGSKRILLIGCILHAVVVFSYAFANILEFFLPISFLDGVASGIEMITLTVLISDFVPANVRGTGVGIYRTFFDAGGIIGPIAMTILATSINPASSFYLSSILFIGTFLITLTLREVSHR
jgi:MFS family permease